MDTLTFIAAITKALAWPAAAVAIALLFRRQFRDLLSRIRKGKLWTAEFEFEREVAELVEAPSAPSSPSMVAAESVPLIANNPRAAILEAWLKLEDAVIRLGKKNGLTSDLFQNPAQYVAALEKSGAITSFDASSFLNMRTLRNQAAHNLDLSPSAGAVTKYVQLAEALANRLTRAAGER
jgi:hypothetical protein